MTSESALLVQPTAVPRVCPLLVGALPLTWGAEAERQRAMESPVRPGFHRVEVQKTTWDVADRYATLRPIGSGAYGTVW
ncbi:Mitogen-activated protein kinase 14A [Liparis tanakae]|uniref:Mitogen-activated protein kinase 14A n=1 Tax=Liparis tanakae TaxID=230148 RepID=A0A4Z2FZV4_9TELE|nr:Mitogen-activated protein kinase 14A [Liparis tanakae]